MFTMLWRSTFQRRYMLNYSDYQSLHYFDTEIKIPSIERPESDKTTETSSENQKFVDFFPIFRAKTLPDYKVLSFHNHNEIIISMYSIVRVLQRKHWHNL